MTARIGLIGTVSTGKTTLAEAFATKHQFLLIEEDARRLYFQKLENPAWDREDPHNQLQFQYEIYTAKIAKELKAFNTGFIADRTYLDNFAYFLHYCSKAVNRELCGFFERVCRSAMNSYTHLFFLPLGSIPYVNDEIRTDTYADALLYETCILGLLERWKLPVAKLIIVKSDLKERIAFIEQSL